MDREKKKSGLLGVLKNLVRRLWVILIFAAIGGAVMYLVTTQYIEPKYHASIRLYINSDGTSDDLVDVCGAVLKSESVLGEIIAESGVKYSWEDLSKMISYRDVNSTNMIEVTVKSPDATEAVNLADIIAFILPDRAEEVIFESKVTVLQFATLPTEPSEPNLGMNTLIGLSAGVILAIILITIVYLLDDAIKDREYLTKEFGIPTLAYVPDYALTKAAVKEEEQTEKNDATEETAEETVEAEKAEENPTEDNDESSENN